MLTFCGKSKNVSLHRWNCIAQNVSALYVLRVRVWCECGKRAQKPTSTHTEYNITYVISIYSTAPSDDDDFCGIRLRFLSKSTADHTTDATSRNRNEKRKNHRHGVSERTLAQNTRWDDLESNGYLCNRSTNSIDHRDGNIKMEKIIIISVVFAAIRIRLAALTQLMPMQESHTAVRLPTFPRMLRVESGE